MRSLPPLGPRCTDGPKRRRMRPSRIPVSRWRWPTCRAPCSSPDGTFPRMRPIPNRWSEKATAHPSRGSRGASPFNEVPPPILNAFLIIERLRGRARIKETEDTDFLIAPVRYADGERMIDEVVQMKGHRGLCALARGGIDGSIPATAISDARDESARRHHRPHISLTVSFFPLLDGTDGTDSRSLHPDCAKYGAQSKTRVSYRMMYLTGQDA